MLIRVNKEEAVKIPDFELGNGWIITVFVLMVSYGPMLFGGKASKRLINFSFSSTRGKVLSAIMMVFFMIWLIYPLFLIIQVGTAAFFIGCVLLVSGAVCSVISFINYFSTPLDQTIEKGMYRISRNPIYVFMTLYVCGYGIDPSFLDYRYFPGV